MNETTTLLVARRGEVTKRMPVPVDTAAGGPLEEAHA
jgi:hypothetical protein